MEDLQSLAIIWIAVFFAHYAAGKTKLTPVLWFLAVGCILVNLGLLPREPSVFIKGFAEIGIIVIMFALGFEENSSDFMRSIKRSWGIAFFGAVAPFSIAYFICFYFWRDVNGALLCALAMTATAVSLTMVSLKSEKLHTSSAATGIMTSAVLDDVAALSLVAVLVPMATTGIDVSFLSIVLVTVKALGFFLLISIMATWLFPVDSGVLARVPLLNRFNLRDLITMQKGEHAILSVLLLALLVALLGHEFGFHPAVGAYMAGLIIKEDYFVVVKTSQSQTSTVFEETRQAVESVAFSWIGPVFFIVLGTQLVLDIPIFIRVIEETLLLTSCLFVGQILSAGLAARYTGKFNWQESWMIGFGMLGRAELAFVVMDIAYRQHSIINDEMFYTLMFTAFLLNISVPVCIRWWKPHFLKATLPMQDP
ncbi:MAG: cation:proton antiporter [Pseudomonadales bacterium]|nr:cation:proton antiporter [Pseudomonadales bacterium]